MAQDSIDLGLMQETNFTSVIYTRESAGYWVVDLDVTGGHCRGVALFYQEFQHFAEEAYQHHGPKFVIFQIAKG